MNKTIINNLFSLLVCDITIFIYHPSNLFNLLCAMSIYLKDKTHCTNDYKSKIFNTCEDCILIVYCIPISICKSKDTFFINRKFLIVNIS